MELIHFDFNKKTSSLAVKYMKIGKITACLGEFDGLHLAHQVLIKRTVELAKKLDIKSAVFTFDPHPDFVLKKRNNLGYLTPLDVKTKVIEDLGIDYFIVIPFSIEVSKLSYEEFEINVLDQFKIEKLIVGFDYRYGIRGSGNTETLKRKYDLEVIEKITFNNEKIGSNEIREFLLNGNLEAVRKTLGRYYNITGKVVHGNEVGRTLGIRTANVNLDDEYQAIKNGIYGVIVTIKGQKYLGVCNIGNNPTLNFVQKARLEVHILDFDEIIYDEIISVDFVVFLRDELKFSNKEDLIEQMKLDINKTRKLVRI